MDQPTITQNPSPTPPQKNTKPFFIIVIIFTVIAIFLFFFLNKYFFRSDEPDSSTEIDLSDDSILEYAYSEQKTPEGFYFEDIENSISYANTIPWINNKELDSLGIDFEWGQICANNKDQALEFSEYINKNLSYYRTLIDQRENEKYFEFTRQYEERPSDIVLGRVHNCNYIEYFTGEEPEIKFEGTKENPTFIESEKNKIAKFNDSPFTVEKFKELVEYLWFIRNYNNNSEKVYQKDISENETEIIYTMYTLQISFGDFNLNDSIKVLREKFYLDKETGLVYWTITPIKFIRGNYNENPMQGF